MIWSSWGRRLVALPGVSAFTSFVGLGTAAFKNTGTSGDAVPLLDAANTWSADQAFTDQVCVGGSTFLTGRTLSVHAASGQPAFAFNAAGQTANQRVMGLIYDGQVALAKAGLVVQNLNDSGVFVSNSATIWRDGSITLGSIDTTAGVGCLRLVGGSLQRGAPVTKTADFTVAAGENWLINNKAGSACSVTLPAASSFPGREITIKNIQALAVNSASSNVVPLVGGAAGTVILTNSAGRWVTLVSDGTNWIAMAGVV